MATKKLKLNSLLNFHAKWNHINCALCASINIKYAVWYDYRTERVIDWKQDYDWKNGEATLCVRCSEKFDDFDILLEL